MRIFEDIIDKVNTNADEESTSSLVSQEDEIYTFKVPSNEIYQEFKFKINVAISVTKQEAVILAEKLYHLLESTAIVEDLSVVHILPYKGETVEYINLHIWFNLTSNPIYESTLNLIISVSNLFFNTKRNSNAIYFYNTQNEDVMLIPANSRQFSLYYYFDTLNDDISDCNDEPEDLNTEASYMVLFNNFMQVFYNKKYNLSNPFTVYKGLYDSVKSININNIRIENPK
jgi:hypothetical protein